MIGKLTGIILEKQPPEITLDVNGVGYEVFLPMTCFFNLPDLNQQVSIYTHLSIREDAHVLFGFLEKKEKTLFRELIKTNGVGPKLALAILSAMSIDQFITALNNEELNKLIKIPGVGKKTAERLLVELKDKFKLNNKLINIDIKSSDIDLNMDEADNKAEAISALITLGYKQNEATNMVNKVYNKNASSENLIREALKQI